MPTTTHKRLSKIRNLCPTIPLNKIMLKGGFYPLILTREGLNICWTILKITESSNLNAGKIEGSVEMCSINNGSTPNIKMINNRNLNEQIKLTQPNNSFCSAQLEWSILDLNDKNTQQPRIDLGNIYGLISILKKIVVKTQIKQGNLSRLTPNDTKYVTMAAATDS